MVNINICNINLMMAPNNKNSHNKETSKIVVILVCVIIILVLVLRIIKTLPEEAINNIIEKTLPLMFQNR